MIALVLAATALFGAPASHLQILAMHVTSVPASVKVKGKVVDGFRWKDDKGESHRNALRLESEPASEVNGFPRDGVITLRIMNTASQQAIKLSPDEALRISTQLLSVAKELMQQKRTMWNRHED